MKTWPETDQERADFTDWQYEVGNGDTILGFRDWITHRDEADRDEPVGADAQSHHPHRGSVTFEDNCTQGLMCPRCGSTGRFTVNALVTCTLFDDGVDKYEGCEYDDDSIMTCGACPHWGSADDFTLPDGPTWTSGPDNVVTATVPSPSHDERAVLTVDADARWTVTRDETSRKGSGPRLSGTAADVETAKGDALTAWRSCAAFEPA